MLWNNQVAFIHAPKTAGMSMTKLLADGLRGPIFITEPVDTQAQEKRIKVVEGGRHATLMEAEIVLNKKRKSLTDFEKVFVVMRNPYDLEVSRYFYLRKEFEVDRGKAQTIAMESPFPEYLKTAPFFGQLPPRLDRYYHMNNYIPENLVILRFEDLAAQIGFYVQPYLDRVQLPHLNASRHENFMDYYDAEAEANCFERHAWFFEKGFYARIRFPQGNAATAKR